MNKESSKKNIIKYIIIIIVVGLLSLIPYMIFGDKDKGKKIELTKNTDYKLKDLEYSIPKGFTYNYSIYDKDMRYYSLYTENNSCDIDISKRKNYGDYKNGEEYLKDRVSFTLNDEISEIAEINQKQKNWYSITKKSNLYDTIEIFNVYVKKDDIYVVKYSYYDHVKGDYEKESKTSICETANNYVLSHLKVN